MTELRNIYCDYCAELSRSCAALISIPHKRSQLYASKENRIYITVVFTRKKVLNSHFVVLFPYCRCSTSHICANNLLDPGTSYYRKSKINIKRKPNFEIGWFHNWPMIISHRLHFFTLQTMIFGFNYKSNDVFYSF